MRFTPAQSQRRWESPRGGEERQISRLVSFDTMASSFDKRPVWVARAEFREMKPASSGHSKNCHGVQAPQLLGGLDELQYVVAVDFAVGEETVYRVLFVVERLKYSF